MKKRGNMVTRHMRKERKRISLRNGGPQWVANANSKPLQLR